MNNTAMTDFEYFMEMGRINASMQCTSFGQHASPHRYHESPAGRDVRGLPIFNRWKCPKVEYFELAVEWHLRKWNEAAAAAIGIMAEEFLQ